MNLALALAKRIPYSLSASGTRRVVSAEIAIPLSHHLPLAPDQPIVEASFEDRPPQWMVILSIDFSLKEAVRGQ
jgi:hypothetical protein